jgi:hypothetical protein
LGQRERSATVGAKGKKKKGYRKEEIRESERIL